MINKQLFKDNSILGIVGTENSGKSNLFHNVLRFVLAEAKKDANIYYYSYTSEVYYHDRIQQISSVRDINDCENGFLFIDEFKFLFQLENRKFKQELDKLFNFLYHQNVKLILCGTEQQFNRFISSKVQAWFIKKVNMKSLINGSLLKDTVMGITKDYVGTDIVKIPVDKYYFEGNLYKSEYMETCDTKKNNLELF